MIDNYKTKKQNEQVVFQSTEDGNVQIIEKRYDEFTGNPVDKIIGTVNSKHINDLIQDIDAQIAPLLQRKQDLKDMLVDVKKEELKYKEQKPESLTEESEKQ